MPETDKPSEQGFPSFADKIGFAMIHCFILMGLAGVFFLAWAIDTVEAGTSGHRSGIGYVIGGALAIAEAAFFWKSLKSLKSTDAHGEPALARPFFILAILILLLFLAVVVPLIYSFWSSRP